MIDETSILVGCIDRAGRQESGVGTASFYEQDREQPPTTVFGE